MIADLSPTAQSVNGQLPQRWSAVQLWALVLAAAALFSDGFDLLAMSYAASSLREQLGLTNQETGVLLASGVLGTIAGGVVLGPIADRFGTKAILTFALLLSAVGMIATTLATSVTALVVIRVITGMGLGGVLPAAYAMAGDYAPSHSRRTTLAFVAIGLPIGGAGAGVCWILTSASLGWPGLFWVGGIFSFIVSFATWRLAPQSLSYLHARGDNEALAALARELPETVNLDLDDRTRPTRGWPALFARELRGLTVALWLASFASLFAYYTVATWLPAATKSSGAAIGLGAYALTTLQVGLTIGGLVAGIALDRVNGYLFVGMAAIVTAATALFAGFVSHPILFVCATFLIGIFSSSTQGGINFISATVFPADVKSTMVGWTISAGRLGGVAAPIIGSGLVSSKSAVSSLLFVSAAGFLVSGGAMLILALLRRDWR